MFSLAEPVTQRDLAVQRGVGKRTDDAAATVEATLSAVRTLIQRDGMIDFNIRELLALAGVSNRAFYRHFPTKEAVIAAIVEEVYGTMVRSLAEAVAGTDDPEAQLVAWIDEALRYAHDPGHRTPGRVFAAYEARLRDEHPEVYRASGRALVAQVRSILAAGAAHGVFAADPTSARAKLVVRLVVATLQHHVIERSTPSVQERDALVAFVAGACR